MYLQNMDASFLAQELARRMREVVPSGIKVTAEEDMLWFESDSYSGKAGSYACVNGCTREMENRSAYSLMRAGTLLMIFKTLLMRPPLNLGQARELHPKRVLGWKMAPSFCGSVMPRLQTSSSNRCRSWHSEGVTFLPGMWRLSSGSSPHQAELDALWVCHHTNEPFAVGMFVQHSPQTLDEGDGCRHVVDPEIEM